MGLRINQNVAAQNSYRNLSITDGQMSKSLEKLSSGFRINRAADDAAGLSISEGLRAQVGGLKVAVRNAQDGISVAQTAEGALNEVHSVLQRMRDLSVQAANDGASDPKAKEAAQAEFAELSAALDQIGTDTAFGKTKLLDGSFTAKDFQIGANTGETVTVTIDQVSAADLSIDSLDLTTGAAAAIDTIDAAIETVSEQRSTLGAAQNRFEHTINNLNVSVENLSASESRIRDTDMAQEMVSFTRSQILTQAGTSMLGQANQASQNVLSLLR